MATRDQPRHGWTVVLRRQLARIVNGRAEGPDTDAFEIICCGCGCGCGDDPGLEYSEVSPRLQLVCGPYPIADGVAAYETQLSLHHQPEIAHRPGAMTDAG